jgi:cytochrome P450
MRIPKDAVLWPNLYAMSRDESVYPDPEHFRPERHLAEDEDEDREEEELGGVRHECKLAKNGASQRRVFTRRRELSTWGFGRGFVVAAMVCLSTLRGVLSKRKSRA